MVSPKGHWPITIPQDAVFPFGQCPIQGRSGKQQTHPWTTLQSLFLGRESRFPYSGQSELLVPDCIIITRTDVFCAYERVICWSTLLQFMGIRRASHMTFLVTATCACHSPIVVCDCFLWVPGLGPAIERLR
jgi:hypothetical protein